MILKLNELKLGDVVRPTYLTCPFNTCIVSTITKHGVQLKRPNGSFKPNAKSASYGCEPILFLFTSDRPWQFELLDRVGGLPHEAAAENSITPANVMAMMSTSVGIWRDHYEQQASKNNDPSGEFKDAGQGEAYGHAAVGLSKVATLLEAGDLIGAHAEAKKFGDECPDDEEEDEDENEFDDDDVHCGCGHELFTCNNCGKTYCPECGGTRRACSACLKLAEKGEPIKGLHYAVTDTWPGCKDVNVAKGDVLTYEAPEQGVDNLFRFNHPKTGQTIHVYREQLKFLKA